MEKKLEKMWDQQRSFIDLLIEKRNFPKYPVDLEKKQDQQFLKSLTHECMGELFEANLHLKNSKQHRKTNISDFSRTDYIKELTDSMHYLFEICIMSGITLDEFYHAYIEKGNENFERINNGY